MQQIERAIAARASSVLPRQISKAASALFDGGGGEDMLSIASSPAPQSPLCQ